MMIFVYGRILFTPNQKEAGKYFLLLVHPKQSKERTLKCRRLLSEKEYLKTNYLGVRTVNEQ